MTRYAVKKGRHYFTGPRISIGSILLLISVIGLILGITVTDWWLIGSAILLQFGLFVQANVDTTMDSRRVYFLSNCTYKLDENTDQVNKLFGFSEGFHHWNSARIGWRCTDGENIELVAYCYISGKRVIKPMIKCKPGTWIFCNIQNKPSKYVFKALNPKGSAITVSVNKKFSIYSLFKLFIYRLFPYFGGKISAPHNMNLYLIKLRME